MAQMLILRFVLYVIAFALGFASLVISALSAASSLTITGLLSIAVFCLAFAGVSGRRTTFRGIRTVEKRVKSPDLTWLLVFS